MAGFLESLLPGGKCRKELKELQEKSLQEPENFHLLVRIGDLLKKMGKKEESLSAYRQASEQYAKNGFLIQAIAVNKLVLQLDPSQAAIHDQLAELYSQRGLIAEEKKERKEWGEGPDKTRETALSVIPLFSDLKKEELSRLMQKIQTGSFYAGTSICEEGDAGDSIFIINHGKVGVFRFSPRGEKISLNELKEGDFFGEFGFFADSRRHATVEALEDTEVLEIKREDLQEIIRQFPGVSEVLFKFYKERILDTLLATSPLFRTLSSRERGDILGKFTLEKISEGQIFLEEGTAGDSLYIIKKGEIEIFTAGAAGTPLTLARLKEADFFGEISLVTGRTRTASARAIQSTELLRLLKKDFDQILAAHPDIRKTVEDSLHLRVENKLRALGIYRDNRAREEMV